MRKGAISKTESREDFENRHLDWQVFAPNIQNVMSLRIEKTKVDCY